MPTSAALQLIDAADRAATALHPLRRQLLEELAEPDSAVGLSRRLGLPRQKVNYHLRQLEADGLVELVDERKKGNCTERLVRATARAYLITPAALGALAADPARVTDRVSAAYLIAVAARAIQELADLRQRAEHTGKKVPTLTIETDVRFANAAAQHAFAEELARDVARVVAKYHDENAAGGRRFRVVLGSYPVPRPKEEP